MFRWLIRIPVIITLMLALAACGSAAARPVQGGPQIDEATATAIAENAFSAINTGDYATWTRDWSDLMKSAITERDFQAFRDALIAARGRFVSISSVERSIPQPGVTRFTYTLAFEQGEVVMWLGFFDGSTKVDGVFLEQ